MQAFMLVLLVQLAAAELSQQLYEGDKCYNRAAQGPGVCRRLQQCSRAMQELQQHGRHPQHCGFIGFTPIVCCPDGLSELYTRQQAVKIAKQKCEKYSAYVEMKMPSPVLIFNASDETVDMCPQTKEPMIVGGENATAREFPHMALIGFGEGEDIDFHCGGSLISHDFVLTAAHCLFTRSGQKARWVLLGELDVTTDRDEAKPQLLEVAEMIRHPDYRPPPQYHDLALLRLKTPPVMSPWVRPACLNWESEPAARATPIATGWGLTDRAGWRSDILLKVALPVQPYSVCSAAHSSTLDRKIPKGILHESQLCAGGITSGKDTCQGDSGGPLQLFFSEKPYYCMHRVIGVTSFGTSCGTPIPGIYTRVSHYLPWIVSKVWPKNKLSHIP